jgi:hypothetical protein
MMSRKLSAGNTIEARCTRCRTVLNHTIVAMVEERVVRIECNTCHGVHNYHPEKADKVAAPGSSLPKKAPVSRTTKKEPGAADREEWASLRPAMNEERAIAYDMSREYRVKNLVAHTVFGLGVVQRVIRPDKMEVLFQGGKKLLRCG